MKTIEEQIACAKRELAMRRRVYPSWVADEQMSPNKSDHEIECMEEIVRTLEKLGPQKQLFE